MRPPCDPSDRREVGHEGDDGGRTVECAPSALPAYSNPPSALARLLAFRGALHACWLSRADALLDLADALLNAQGPVASLPHLSLEPAHRRSWGSTDAALARGRIDAERLRDLLAAHPLAGG
jgi:hypothetical protein